MATTLATPARDNLKLIFIRTPLGLVETLA
jgi:hypothetical protein